MTLFAKVFIGGNMAHVLIMPRQGNTVESCIIVEWKKKEGDTVDSETVVCEVETDKATFEVPAGEAGTILKILYAEGDDVPVLQPIMVVGQPGEKWEDSVKAPPQTEAPEAVPHWVMTVSVSISAAKAVNGFAPAEKPHDSAVPAGEESGAESPLLQIWTLVACGRHSTPLDPRPTSRPRGCPTYLGGRRGTESAVLLAD